MSYFRLIRSCILTTTRPVTDRYQVVYSFTSSRASSFNVTFDSLIKEILLHIKLAEITKNTSTGLILKIFFYDQLFYRGHCVRLVSVSAFSTEAQICLYIIYQTDKDPTNEKKKKNCKHAW
jgi:hypothetical protein